MSAQNLADAIGVSVATVFRWESGEQSPPLDKAQAIAKACGVTLDDLVDAAA